MAQRRAEEALAQGGKCWWCQVEMTPIPENAHLGGTPHPATMVTLDHVFQKGDPRRLANPRKGERRYVAACHRCNQQRSLANSLEHNRRLGFTKTKRLPSDGRAEPRRVD